MRLKAGAAPRKTQTAVAQLWMELGNIHGGQAEQARGYVNWVQAAETTLRNHFEEIDLDRLYTHRFWRISVGDIDQLSYMITHEETVQREWLDQLKLELDEGIKRFGNLDAAIVVPDTNALLHYRLSTRSTGRDSPAEHVRSSLSHWR